MEVKIPNSLEKDFPDVSVLTLKDGYVRILCGSRPEFAIDTVDKVAAEITALNSHLERVSFEKRTNRHGKVEGALVFKEK